MAYTDITQASVLKAIEEYDEIGRDAFLERYGFRDARQYVLRHKGKIYPSKAIVGAAHSYAFPDLVPLEWDDFSGGRQTVAPVLERLGFEVTEYAPSPEKPRRNPDWTRDEIILALEFYLLHRETMIPGKNSVEIAQLANEIRSVAHASVSAETKSFAIQMACT